MVLSVKIITLRSSLISYELIYLLGKGGKTVSKEYPQKDMRSDEKFIIDRSVFIKVWFLLYITPLYDIVLGAHKWDIIPCFVRKETNLLDPNSPLWYDQSPFICLLNRFSKVHLKFNEFIQCIRFYTYPHLE